MTLGVTDQAIAAPEPQQASEPVQDKKELNFRRIEADRDAQKEKAIRAEMESQYLRKELEQIKIMLQPKETDPLDGVEDYVDKEKLRAVLSKQEKNIEKRAGEIANQIYEKRKAEEDKKDPVGKLQQQYSDFNSVMTEDNIKALYNTDPDFVNEVMDFEDEYKRKKMAYNHIKKYIAKPTAKVEAPVQSIKDKVAENQKNPYHIPDASGYSSSAYDMDVKTPEAKQKAYEKLKAAQRNPIGKR